MSRASRPRIAGRACPELVEGMPATQNKAPNIVEGPTTYDIAGPFFHIHIRQGGS